LHSNAWSNSQCNSRVLNRLWHKHHLPAIIPWVPRNFFRPNELRDCCVLILRTLVLNGCATRPAATCTGLLPRPLDALLQRARACWEGHSMKEGPTVLARVLITLISTGKYSRLWSSENYRASVGDTVWNLARRKRTICPSRPPNLAWARARIVPSKCLHMQLVGVMELQLNEAQLPDGSMRMLLSTVHIKSAGTTFTDRLCTTTEWTARSCNSSFHGA
jgi:hypothetical protein